MISDNDNRNKIIGRIDWVTLLIYFALVLIGWFSIFSAKYNELHPSIFDFSMEYGKQLIWIGAAFFFGFIILLIDAKFFNAFSLWIYIIVLSSLVMVLVYGKATKGATSWIEFGPVKFQPSEFAKMATALALAGYLDRLDVDLSKRKDQIVCAALIVIPMALVLLQNDTGSALVFISFILVLYREGMPGAGWLMIIGVVAALLFVFTLVLSQKAMFIILGAIMALVILYLVLQKKRDAYVPAIIVFALAFGMVFSVDYAFNKVLQEHQRNRVLVLLGQLDDPKGVGYNVYQSKIAIGSGGFAGKGFLQGTQTKYDFVPEQHTDFIFCTIGEEGGFLGTSAVVLLYVGLLVKIILMAERQRSTFSRVYGYSIAGILFVHVAINIGMTIGLMPVIGIPLPFLSYGGSSMLAFTIMLAIFVKQDANRLNIL
jgi:rod shape determining protein RodA